MEQSRITLVINGGACCVRPGDADGIGAIPEGLQKWVLGLAAALILLVLFFQARTPGALLGFDQFDLEGFLLLVAPGNDMDGVTRSFVFQCVKVVIIAADGPAVDLGNDVTQYHLPA
jgi:hypothetical protein